MGDLQSPFTRLVCDYLPDDGTDYDPQEPGWRIHDFPNHGRSANWIAGGLEEAEAKFIVGAVNAAINVQHDPNEDLALIVAWLTAEADQSKADMDRQPDSDMAPIYGQRMLYYRQAAKALERGDHLKDIRKGG